MASLLFFIPAAVCLFILFLGAVGVIVTILRLRGTGAPPSGKGKWKFGLSIASVTALTGLLCLWFTGSSIIGWGGAPAEWSDGRAPELEPLIRSRCAPFVQRGDSVGMAVAVVSSSQATLMTFGRSSLFPGAPITKDTLFEIGSITKTMTAVALARAIESGAMRLDQPIQELLPSDVQLPAPAQTVTLRHLTTHTSGFPRLPGITKEFLPGMLKMLLFGSDPYAWFTEEKLFARLRSVRLDSEPGVKSEYSNFGLITLGYLLSRNAGTNYESLVLDEVCRPLGMNDTTVELNASQLAHFAQGYRAVSRHGRLILALRSSPWDESGALGGAGALRSTGGDMLKYLVANMSPAGKPIETALRTAQQELFRMNDTTAHGMNWVRSRGKDFTHDLIWHNGGTGGFASSLGFTEDGRTGVVLLSNTAESVDDLAFELLRELNGPAPDR